MTRRADIRKVLKMSDKDYEKFTKTADVINHLPDIENKRYLELGIDAGWTFDNVPCKDKVGIDIKPEVEPDYCMTTDKYFAKLHNQFTENEVFDLIFIDADHSAQAVVKDFNNSVNCLTYDGLILIHDLAPRAEEEIGACGDGFKWLYKVRECIKKNGLAHLQLVTCRDNHGLTMISRAQSTNFYWTKAELDAVTFQDFMRQQAKYKRPTQQEMCLQMQNIRDIIPKW